MDPLDEHAVRHNRQIDSTVAWFERRLNAIVADAQARLTAELLGNLQQVDGRLVLGRDGLGQVVRIAQRFKSLMNTAGFPRLISDLHEAYARQIPTLSEALKIMGLRAPRWGDADKAFFERNIEASNQTIAGVVDLVGQRAKQRALTSINGLRPADLAAVLAAELHKTGPQAAAIADTAITVHYRMIAARAFDKIEAAGPALEFKYYGPRDRLNRPFCQRLLSVDRVYSRENIAQMDNGQGTDVFVACGGYRCRHQWLAALTPKNSAALDIPPVRSPLIEPGSPEIARAFEAAFEDSRLSAGLFRAVPSVPVELVSGKDLSSYVRGPGGVARILLNPKDLDPQRGDAIRHEYLHHVDYSLAQPGQMTVSNDPESLVGAAFNRARNEFVSLLHDSKRSARTFRSTLGAVSDLAWRDLYGSLSLNKVASGHTDGYFIADFGRVNREAFANLGAIYARRSDDDLWSLVKLTTPDLAQAWLEWLDSVR